MQLSGEGENLPPLSLGNSLPLPLPLPPGYKLRSIFVLSKSFPTLGINLFECCLEQRLPG